MSRESLVFLFGLGVFLLPFLGIPLARKDQLIILFGAILVALGYSLRRSAYLRRAKAVALREARENQLADSPNYETSTPKTKQF